MARRSKKAHSELELSSNAAFAAAADRALDVADRALAVAGEWIAATRSGAPIQDVGLKLRDLRDEAAAAHVEMSTIARSTGR